MNKTENYNKDIIIKKTLSKITKDENIAIYNKTRLGGLTNLNYKVDTSCGE